MKKFILTTLCSVFVMLFSTSQAEARGQEGMIGEVRMFAGNFAPRGWAFCNGQKLAISSNTALFSILGTTYGGDGRTTFCLPDLRGRTPVHVGKAPGLSDTKLGQKSGVEKKPVKKGEDAEVPGRPRLGMNYIICVIGDFPSR